MPSVFISYARDDEAMAGRVADALTERGYEVLRDTALPAHRPYAEVIEEWLAGADAVLVLWSAAAARSQWVRAEADVARNRSCLVQASLDGSVPPLPFNQVQCASLSGWNGEGAHGGWETVEASLAALAGRPAGESQGQRPRERGLSICVLPFQNMSGDPEQAYFSDGISEDITTDLSQISALEVIARNTAFTFKGQSVDVAEVARSLGVSHVLEGSVRKAGNRVRISAQLIDGKSGGQVWAQRFDRDLDDIFAIQDEISKAIVDALKVRLLPEEKEAIEARGTTNAVAYNYYLMARQQWALGNHGDRRREERVVRMCERALSLDPDYARALALMALAQSSLRYGFNDETVDGGIAAAKRALELDPGIAEAHCVIGRHYVEQGRLEEGLEELETALATDPESWEVNKEVGRIFFRHRRIDEAARCFKKATELLETDFHAWGMLFSCYSAQGDEAGRRHAAQMLVKQVELALRDDPNNGAALSLGAAGWGVLGEPDKARAWIDRALLVDPDNMNMRYNFACALSASLNDPEGALEMLEPVMATVGPGLVKLASTDTDFDNIRDHPRFEAMLAAAHERLGLPAGG